MTNKETKLFEDVKCFLDFIESVVVVLFAYTTQM